MQYRLRQIRQEKGISQLRLSYLTGIQPSTISRVENGHMKAFPGWRKRLARALGTTESELFPDERRQDGNH